MKLTGKDIIFIILYAIFIFPITVLAELVKHQK